MAAQVIQVPDLNSNPFPEGFGGISPVHVSAPKPPKPAPVAVPSPSPASIPLAVPSHVKVSDATDLLSKAVLFITRYGVPGNSRQVSGAGILDTDADQSLLRVSKQLLNSPELDAIKKADTKMRTLIYNTCHPFEQGIGLLPIGLIDSTVERCEEYKAVTRPALVKAFLDRYPVLCELASKALGSLHCFSDYPSVEAMETKFTFTYSIRTFSTPAQLQNISSQIYQREVQKAAEQVSDAGREITALMRQTMYEMVSHLQEKLTPGDDGKPRILRESAVNNLQEFLSTFHLRNITDDTQLAAVVSQARTLLSGADAGLLRNSDLFREKIRTGMEGITAQLSGLVELKPGRMFREE